MAVAMFCQDFWQQLRVLWLIVFCLVTDIGFVFSLKCRYEHSFVKKTNHIMNFLLVFTHCLVELMLMYPCSFHMYRKQCIILQFKSFYGFECNLLNDHRLRVERSDFVHVYNHLLSIKPFKTPLIIT